MVLNKWGVALLQLVVFLLTTYTLFNQDAVVTTVEWWQFGGLFVAQVGVVVVPLTTGGYAAALKVGVAAGGALFQAVVVIIDTSQGGPGWTSASVIVVALAVANAVAVHFGVDTRLDKVKEILTDPKQANSSIRAVDPKAVEIVQRQGVTPLTPALERGADFRADG